MLTLLTSPPPGAIPGSEVRVFIKARNEAARLPYLLTYYRELGAHRFIVVDNESTDGTRALLQTQPDVHLYNAAGSFREAGGGQAWLDTLLNEHGTGHWCLTVDADELLCYPASETVDLRALCDSLSSEGAEALSCMLLDMYGDEAVGRCRYDPGQPFIDACPWFDAAPYWRTGPTSACPPYEVYGGIRQRMFYPRWQTPDLALRISERFFDIGNRFPPFRKNTTLQARRAKRPPNLAKVPLVRWRSGLRYLACTHRISNVKLSARSGCLLHFKFLGDFEAKAVQEARRGEYFDGAREYKRYAAEIAERPRLTLWHEGSVRFEGSEQLCRLGLMADLPDAAANGRLDHADA